jgi:protease secretion system membrane fusion protein
MSVISTFFGGMQKLDGKLGGWIGGWNPYQPEKLQGKTIQAVKIEESNIRKVLARWFLGMFVVFLGWAFFAPIDSGVTSQGTVTVLGNRKTVQHPSGGIVQEILVKEGAEVKQGQVLIRINPLKSEAEMSGVELQYINLLASESRLKSERDSLGSIRWVDDIGKQFKPSDTRVLEAKSLQNQLFNSRRADYNSQVSSLNEQISSLQNILKSRQMQQKSINEEMRNIKALAKDGFVPQAQANQAERQNVDIESNIATTQSDISRARLQISQLRTAYIKEVDNQLQELQKNRDPLQTRLDAVKFDKALTEVRAPVSGSVVGLKVFTVGSVVGGGVVMMEVVPKDEALIVQVKFPANSIDKVRVGMEAQLRFTAFNVDTTPVVPGIVKLVGADKEPGQQGADGEFYLGQVETTPEGLEMLGKLKVQPGMNVDVIIKTGERSFMSLVMKPITDKAVNAFR